MAAQQLPFVGLGTLGLKESCESAVAAALEAGCAVVDTGEHYGNLSLVGSALKRASGRASVVVKLSGLPSGDYSVVRSRFVAVLQQLGLEAADICLAHWPGLCTWDPTDMSPLESPAAFRDMGTTWHDFCENLAAAWTNLKRLQEEGLTKEIGTSNFYQPHLDELASRCEGAVPFANEIFIDSSNQEMDFVAEMQRRGIRVFAYRPVAYRPFPEAVQLIAARLSVSPQAVVLAWLLKRGVWPLVKCRGAHVAENFSAGQLCERLTPADLAAIASAEVGMRASPEWFAKIWRSQNQAALFTDEDVQMLVSMGVDEAKARRALEGAGGNLDLAMDAAFAED